MRSELFTELIRRKLESIRPDATERDWIRMQSSLRGAGLSRPSAGVGAGVTWLLTGAGAGVLALLALVVWQRLEIETLRGTLAQNTVRLNRLALAEVSRKFPVLVPAGPDTVYITQYIRIPIGQNGLAARNLNPAHNRPTASDLNAAGLPADSLALVPESRAVMPSEARPVQQPLSTPAGAISTEQQQLGLPATKLAQPANNGVVSRAVTIQKAGENEVVLGRPSGSEPETSDRSDRIAGVALVTPISGELSRLATTQLLFAPVNWNARILRKLRRGPILPNHPAAAERPESESVSRATVQPRVGVGTDVQTGGWKAGVVVELLTDRHWTVSAGLVRSSQLLGSYLSDDDYDYQTSQSFRREFAPTSDPRRDIYGIGIHSIRYQIPITVGYRIGLGRSLSFTPSLGTYVDLGNTVQVSFSYRKPLRQGFDRVDLQNKRSHELINAYTAGAALEWQQKQWVVQGGLLYTHPFFADPNGIAAPALGGRMRLLFQF